MLLLLRGHASRESYYGVMEEEGSAYDTGYRSAQEGGQRALAQFKYSLVHPQRERARRYTQNGEALNDGITSFLSFYSFSSSSSVLLLLFDDTEDDRP